MMNKSLFVFVLCFFNGIVSANKDEGYKVPAVIYSKSEVVIASEARGAVEHILDVGAKFKKGDVLFKIESAHEERLLANYINQKELINRKLEKQQIIAKGYVELKQKNSVSDYLLFERQVDVLNSQSELERLKMEIDKIKNVLSKKTVLAPYDGVVIKKNISMFQRIAEGESIIAIYNPNDLYLKAFVSASKVNSLVLDSVELSDFPETQRATLDYISPSVNQGSNTVEVSFRLPEEVALIGESIFIRFN